MKLTIRSMVDPGFFLADKGDSIWRVCGRSADGRTKESFASGKYPTVVGIVDDDCILVKVVSLEVLDACPTRESILEIALEYLAYIPHFGKIRMVGSEDHFLGVNGFVLMIAKGPWIYGCPRCCIR